MIKTTIKGYIKKMMSSATRKLLSAIFQKFSWDFLSLPIINIFIINKNIKKILPLSMKNTY